MTTAEEGIVIFTVVVTNVGPNIATGVTVSDVLAPRVEYVSHTGGDYDPMTGLWTIGTLTNSTSITLEITAFSDLDVPTNYAQVATSDQEDPDSTPGNDSVDEDDDASIGAISNEGQGLSSSSAPALLATECVELAANGDFESTGEGWTLSEGIAAPVYTSELTFNDSGQAMRLGIVDDENLASISAIDQVVALPGDANSIILSFRYYPLYEAEPGPGDLQYVDIYNVLTGQFAGRALGTQSNERTWLTTDYDLTMQAGQDVRIVFAVNNDGVEGRSAMYVDNVSVLSCQSSNLVSPGEAPTPDPALGVGNLPASEQAPLLLAGREEEGSTWLSRLTAMGVLASVAGVIAFAVMVVIGTLRSTE
jgi:uncharacterized repeat protein (TIGR01451 family)